MRHVLALALVGHLWMLTPTAAVSAPPVGDDLLALWEGDAGAAPASEMDPHAHWMALSCLAVVALSVAVLSPRRWPVRRSARRLSPGRAGQRWRVTTVRARDLWPPPAPGDRPVVGGTVLLV